MEARLDELETRLAFQDQAIEELSDVIARQQREIELLQGVVRKLADQVKEMRPSLLQQAAATESPPPHY